MSFTVQQLIDRARVPLNDSDADRYADAELVTYAQDAYLMIRRLRPDLFVGSYSALTAFATLTALTTFPSLDDSYLPTLADYVTARAEFKDDEAAVRERAAAFYALFQAGARG